MGADWYGPGKSKAASKFLSSCAGLSAATTPVAYTRAWDDGADQETDARGGATTTCDTPSADGCRDGCCDGHVNDANGHISKDGSGRASLQSDSTNCCGAEEQCHEKCIAVVAAMECEKACVEDADEHGQPRDSACSSHLRSAFERYAAYIAQARCICRTVLERPLFYMLHQAKKNATKINTATTIKKKSATLALSGGKSRYTITSKTSKKMHHKHSSSDALVDELTIKSGSTEPDKSGCCGGSDHHHAANPTPLRPTTPQPAWSRVREEVNDDAEYDTGGTEAVAIFIAGMTCAGCAEKMARALKSTPGVSQVRVNFVMSKADFSVDRTITTPDHVIRAVEGATGFRCTRIAGDGDHTLDVLASRDAVSELLSNPAHGVTGVTVANKGVRLHDQTIKTVMAAVLTIPVVVLAWGDTLADEKTKAHVWLVLASLVQLIAVPEFYRPAISALVHLHVLEMDMLVVISITAAFLYSVVAYGFRVADQPLETSEFFETSTLLITLILLGRLIATYARVKAVSAVSVRSMQANTAVLVEKEGGQDREIDARLLQCGDEFKILPHTRVPTDGVVISGSSEFDESMLTGEPIPAPKRPQDHVIAGTVNGDGTIVAKLTRLPGKNTVTDIAAMVEEAANSKRRFQDVANRVASWFVPVVTVVSLIAFVVWVLVGLKGRNWPTSRSVVNALTYWVAILAVSCPCALGLAVPMVLVIAGGIAARGGVVIKSADCTERVRKCTDVIFDKTGAITEGKLDAMVEEIVTSDREGALAIAKALVAGGKHPVSAALDKHLASHSVEALSGVEDIRVVAGCGVEASLNGRIAPDQGLTILVITSDGNPLAVFGFRTLLRPEAAHVIGALQARNITVHLVSGDQTRAVQAVAAAVGIPLENVAAERSPGEKRDYAASVMEGPKKYVLFCGDGTNDAVAVAQAHTGVQGAADVVLLAGLGGIPFLLDVSRAAFNRMVFNFVWSAVYNVVAILMAGGAFVYVRIPPAYAGLGEIVSILPVIFAALSMLLLNLRQKA
ncbi:heavy metal translocatin [Sodiomyces alkalinus F11]|uniref:Heavy metal translocatin n=1 Tax=Sodiomyces alkalinus (strain CBS 110278 / VKM F-3762 / F11) TaxID=1314773 RepID=A0A3N2Q1M5_SODAK|nr:heavy metal translocatin [Sodiomyces alkalinus F11]ROT40588.1 heavy metal translocatin [Sodiomyces alkalinus F11]